MAAKKVIVALVLFALLGMALAAPAPESAPKEGGEGASAAPGPAEGIGNDEESGDGATAAGFAEAGPVGGPVPDGVFQDTPTDPATGADSASPKNSAPALEGSAVIGAAATAAAFSLFYF